MARAQFFVSLFLSLSPSFEAAGVGTGPVNPGGLLIVPVLVLPGCVDGPRLPHSRALVVSPTHTLARSLAQPLPPLLSLVISLSLPPSLLKRRGSGTGPVNPGGLLVVPVVVLPERVDGARRLLVRFLAWV